MTRFNYLQAAQPEWLRRLHDLGTRPELRASILAVCCAVLVGFGLMAIERDRYYQTALLAQQYNARFETGRRRLHESTLYYRRTFALLTLDKQVHDIMASSDADASRIALLANALPPHAWLTSMTLRGDGIDLEGEVRDFGVVSDVLWSLAHTRGLREPVLKGAALVADRPASRVVRYALYVGTPNL